MSLFSSPFALRTSLTSQAPPTQSTANRQSLLPSIQGISQLSPPPPPPPLSTNCSSNINTSSGPKIKCTLTCSKREKKHQSFELIFICLEKSCEDSFRPICAQCLHEDHSGHSIKLIKEIAEIATAFIQTERNKDWANRQPSSSSCLLSAPPAPPSTSPSSIGSPYWNQLQTCYDSLYQQLDDIVGHLRGLQDTLHNAHTTLFYKLHSEKDTYFDIVDSTAQKILKDKCYSEDDLLSKIRLIMKNVDINEPISTDYRHTILKEDAVPLVLSHYSFLSDLAFHAKEFVQSSLIPQQLIDAYAAANFKISEDEEYMRITTASSNNIIHNPDEIQQQQFDQPSRIVEIDEDHKHSERSDDDSESQPDHDLYHDYDDVDSDSSGVGAVDKIDFFDDDEDIQDDFKKQKLGKSQSKSKAPSAAIADSNEKKKLAVSSKAKKTSDKQNVSENKKKNNNNNNSDSDDFDVIESGNDAEVAAKEAKKQKNLTKIKPKPIVRECCKKTSSISLQIPTKPLPYSRLPQPSRTTTSSSSAFTSSSIPTTTLSSSASQSSYLSRIEDISRTTANKARTSNNNNSDINSIQKESDFFAGIESRSDQYYKPFKAEHFLEGVRGIFDKGTKATEPATAATRTRGLASDSTVSALGSSNLPQNLNNYETDSIFEKFRKISTKQEEAHEKLRKFQDNLKRGSSTNDQQQQSNVHWSPTFGSISISSRQPAIAATTSTVSSTSSASSYTQQSTQFTNQTELHRVSNTMHSNKVGDRYAAYDDDSSLPYSYSNNNNSSNINPPNYNRTQRNTINNSFEYSTTSKPSTLISKDNKYTTNPSTYTKNRNMNFDDDDYYDESESKHTTQHPQYPANNRGSTPKSTYDWS